MLSRPVTISFVLLSCIFLSFPPQIIFSNNNCENLHIIFARGSGQKENDFEEDRFKSEIRAKFTEEDQNYINTTSLDYPAVSISGLDKSAQQIRNGASAEFEYAEDVFGGEYRESVSEGNSETVQLVEDIASECYQEDTRIVIGGYSQGAHAVGDALYRLSPAAREMIVYVGLFGDPKFKTDSYASMGNFANSNGGILEERNRDFPDDFRGKLESWCLNGDGICEDNAGTAIFGTHGNYPERIIPAAATQAYINYERSKKGIPFSQHDSVPEFSGTITDSERLLLQEHNEDIVLLADTSSSLRGNWYYSRDILGRFFEEDIASPQNYVGISAYQNPEENYRTNQISYLRNINVRESFNSLAGTDGSKNEYDNMDLVEGIKASLKYQKWREGAKKKLLIVTDSPLYENDTSLEEIKKIAIRNNVQINMAVKFSYHHSLELLESYEDLATSTGGDYIVISGNYRNFAIRIANLLRNSFSKPVVSSSNSYEGYEEDPILLRVESSYDQDNYIMQYEWDFDSDGNYDQKTYHPVVSHAFKDNGDKDVIVRATAADGGVGYGTLRVKVHSEEKKPEFTEVKDPKITEKNKEEYKLSWGEPNNKPISYSLYKDDSLIGIVDSDKTTAIIEHDEKINNLYIESDYEEGSSDKVKFDKDYKDTSENEEKDNTDEDTPEKDNEGKDTEKISENNNTNNEEPVQDNQENRDNVSVEADESEGQEAENNKSKELVLNKNKKPNSKLGSDDKQEPEVATTSQQKLPLALYNEDSLVLPLIYIFVAITAGTTIYEYQRRQK